MQTKLMSRDSLLTLHFNFRWLGMTWLLPAELTNLRTRIHANAVSTIFNWLSNFVIVMITPPAFTNLQYKWIRYLNSPTND